MSGEVTVRPKAEAAHQLTVEQQFLGFRDSIKSPQPKGIRADHLASLRAHVKRGRAELKSAAVLASKGGVAATDIGNGDEESGEKIANC